MSRIEENSSENVINDKNTLKGTIIDWAKTILISLGIAILITSFVKPTLVVGSSMYPTFQNHNYLLVNRMVYMNSMPQHQDIIVFNSKLPGKKILIKRVIATEGDKLVIGNGKVWVNDQLQNEPYVHGQDTLGYVNTIIPKGAVFVMGDNRANSEDSRFLDVGYINKTGIIGKVFFGFLPFGSIKS